MISAPYWSMTLATAIWVAEGCKVSWGALSCAATVIGEINAIKRREWVTRVVIMSLTLKGGWGSAESLCIRCESSAVKAPRPGISISLNCESDSHQHPAVGRRKTHAVPSCGPDRL